MKLKSYILLLVIVSFHDVLFGQLTPSIPPWINGGKPWWTGHPQIVKPPVVTQIIPGINKVAIIAHSISTGRDAEKLLARFRWQLVPLKKADGILVVCRSMLANPLNHSYGDIRSLDKDADMQMNICGELFHAYVYQINNDLSVSLVKHFSRRAHDLE